MQITALGHSCVLLDLDTADGPSTRILVDPWLSDHATGDAMGRFPRLRFDIAALGTLDAVFISHAHSDHLDPYTLARLWAELPTTPVLLLPVSLTFLIPLLHTHLPNLDVQLLFPHDEVGFRGLTLTGFFDVGATPTNEDDVMVLVVQNDAEVVLVEADARLSLEVPDFRSYVSQLLTRPGIETAVYLTTENELTGTLGSRMCVSLPERAQLVDHAVNEMLQAVDELYEPSDDPEDLWQATHLIRLVHGQGLTAPHELDARWQRILFPVTIAARVREERVTAERNGCRHQIGALEVGAVHTLTGGRVVGTTRSPGLELLDHEDRRTYDPTLAFFPDLPVAPLRADSRDLDQQRQRIGAMLDQRFLPWLHGLGDPPVLHLLWSSGGLYRIRVHYGDIPDAEARDYVLGYGARGFIEDAPSHDEPDEAYWANDLDDVLEGRCDEFSPFSRTQFNVAEMRLWTCLATPLLNSDLVTRRVALHFQRAAEGLTAGSYVLALYDLDMR